MTIEQDWADPKNSPALANAVLAAQVRHRDVMDRLSAQIEDLVREPSPSVSIAACVAVGAQLALQHAVELLSLRPGDDLEAEAARLVGSVWDSARSDAPRRVADLLDTHNLDGQISENAISALAAMLAAGQAFAQISPKRWRGGTGLPRLVTRLAMLEGVADEQDPEATAFFTSFRPTTAS